MTGVEEFRSGFAVVATAMVGLYVSVTHLYSMGVMMQPIEQETGWSRMQISSGLTVVSVVSVILAPLVGMMIDRWGPRRIAGCGVLVYCCALAGLGATGAFLWSWWLAWLCLAAGSVLVKPTVWTVAVAQRFSAARGMALAIALCGTGLSTALLPTIAAKLLEVLKWREVYVALSLGSAVIVLPLVYLFLDSPRRLGSRPAKMSEAEGAGLTGSDAMRTRQFYALAVAGFSVTIAVTSIVVHFVPMLVAKGVTREVAISCASAIGAASIAGRLATGAFLDRFAGPVIGAVAFSLPIGSCLMLMTDTFTSAGVMLVALGVGLAAGAELDILAYLCTRYFGLRSLGLIFGTIAGLLSLAAGLGPLLAGAVYDRFGGYDLLFAGLVPLLTMSAVLMARLGPYPDSSAIATAHSSASKR